jgi:hypothetical protein
MRVIDIIKLYEFAPPEGQEDLFQKLATIAQETLPGDEFHEKAMKLMQIVLNKAGTVQPEPVAQEPAQPVAQPVAQEPAQPVAQEPAQPVAQDQLPAEEDEEEPVIAERAPVKKTVKQPDDLVWEEYLNTIADPKARTKIAKDPQIKASIAIFIKSYESKKEAAKKEINDLAGSVLARISKDGASDSEKESLVAIIATNNVPEEHMKFLLKGAKTGMIIDMTSLVNSYNGKIDDHVRQPYKDIFSKVIGNFFNLADGMRTAGNIGPGEVAFVLLGNPAKKMNKGDLEVGKESFEVKASSDTPGKLKQDGTPGASKPNGAVFGAKVNQKPASAWPIVQEILNKYGIAQTTRTVTNKTTGETKELERFKINSSGMTDLNAELDSMGMPKAKRANLMADILEQLFPKIVKQNKKEFVQHVALTMDPTTGHFPTEDSGELMKLLAKTALTGYKLEKHKENFIFFNKSSRTYYVFRGDEMSEAIDDGTIRLFKGIDWSDGQYPAAPKMYIS